MSHRRSFATAVQFYAVLETNCADGRDDNGNGAADCADADCDQKACSANRLAGTCQGATCVAAVCSPQGTESGASACSDGADNDCDGSIDCDDAACDGSPCEQNKISVVLLDNENRPYPDGLAVRDEGFNPPSTGTSYAVTAWNDVVSAKIVDPPFAVDRLPAFFSQAYCNWHHGMSAMPASPSCSNRCTSSPCYAVTSLTGFATAPRTRSTFDAIARRGSPGARSPEATRSGRARRCSA